VYVVGTVGGVWGVLPLRRRPARDGRFSDDAHQFGGIGVMAADHSIYGRIYVRGTGSGLLYSN
jgi:xyloglucan-specific exo-beta-1,4-glucanase